MNVKTFHAYLDLMNEEMEEKKKAREKAKLRAKQGTNSKATGLGGKTP